MIYLLLPYHVYMNCYRNVYIIHHIISLNFAAQTVNINGSDSDYSQLFTVCVASVQGDAHHARQLARSQAKEGADRQAAERPSPEVIRVRPRHHRAPVHQQPRARPGRERQEGTPVHVDGSQGKDPQGSHANEPDTSQWQQVRMKPTVRVIHIRNRMNKSTLSRSHANTFTATATYMSFIPNLGSSVMIKKKPLKHTTADYSAVEVHYFMQSVIVMRMNLHTTSQWQQVTVQPTVRVIHIRNRISPSLVDHL